MKVTNYVRTPVLALLSCSFAAQPSSAQGMSLLSRNGNWEIQYDSEACHLIGAFGHNDEEVIVRFSRSERSDHFRLALYGKPFASTVRDNTLTLDFGQAKGPAIVTAQAGMAGARPVLIATTSFATSGKPEIVSMSIADMVNAIGKPPPPPRITPDQEAAVTRLIAGLPNGQSINLNLGSMGAPMASMRACVDDLIRSWGYDPDAISALSAKPVPIGSPANWITDQDYPKLGLVRGHSGVIRFRLDIDAKGQVRKCAILEQLAAPEFRDATCSNISRRAKFKPALDASGKPTNGYYTSSVYWKYPG